jgi:quinone-modifying oxidoreductase, subunit QmoC
MAYKVNPDLASDLARFGAGDVINCFNCGNCTAVCPLSEGDTAFPRKMLRYVQLGLKEQLVQSPEPWLCYYCGECSASCPRDAKPGETMAALRRYAIASSDPTGLAGLMYRSPALAVMVSLLLAGVLGFFLTSLQPSYQVNHWIFRLVPYAVIHTVGIGVSVLFGLLAVTVILKTIRQYSRMLGGADGVRGRGWSRVAAAFKEVGREIVTMKRHRQCEVDPVSVRWYLTPRIVHIGIVAGFLGLLLATLLDFVFVYLLAWTAFPNCGCCAARLLGTISGLVMLYGVSVSIYQRVQGRANHLKHSVLADWWLLVFLFVLAVTGFWLEIAVLFRWQGRVQDVVLLLHTVMAMELILMTMLTKLSHAVYRPLALGLYFIRHQQNQHETN